jgi:hypothetical protein
MPVSVVDFDVINVDSTTNELFASQIASNRQIAGWFDPLTCEMHKVSSL